MDIKQHPLPPLFLSHGSPMTALEPRAAGAFMQQLGGTLSARFGKPLAIVAVSAHSLAHATDLAHATHASQVMQDPVLLAAARHEAIHDFGGFDPRLYTLRYSAPGAPALATRVQALLQQQGLPVRQRAEGGLDHGIWTPLRYLFPDADIPVLPLAWPPGWPPERLFALGRALALLADEGVLIVGSGSITHNLRRVFAGSLQPDPDRAATPESTAFRDWFAQQAAAADWPRLFDYRRQAPHAVLMHPTDEHLLPFFVAAGAGGEQPAPRIHASVVYGDLGMDAYAFGPQAAALQAALQAALSTAL